MALTKEVSHTVTFSGKVTHPGPMRSTQLRGPRAYLGSIVELGRPYALLLLAGPTFFRGQASFQTFTALGLSF